MLDGLRLHRAVGDPVPGRTHEDARHAAKTGDAGDHQARAYKSRNAKKPGRHEEAQDRAEERKAASADLNLPLQLDWLTAVGYDGEPRTFFQASRPPSMTKASHVSSTFPARRAACPAVRAPLLQ